MAKEELKKTKEEKKIITSQDQLKTFLKDNADDHYNGEVESVFNISTGSVIFDSELGGALEVPGIVRMSGVSGGGKTSESLLLMKNFLEGVPNSKSLVVKAEGRLSSKVKEKSGVTFVDTPEEWVTGTCFVFKCNIYETVTKLIISLFENNPENIKYFVLIDSMDGLMTKGDDAKTIGEDMKVAGAASLTPIFLRKIVLPVSVYGHLVALISQVRSNVQLNAYIKTDPKLTNASGGNALQHWADHMWEFQPRYKGDQIMDGAKIIGHYAKLVIRKSDNEKDSVEVRYPIKHGQTGGNSIWIEYEIADLLIGQQLVTKAGAWIKFNEDLREELKQVISFDCVEQVQGLDKLRTYLEENPTLTKYLYDLFRKANAK